MARFAWFVPAPLEGSGGHRTIFRVIAALRRRGHSCDVYVHLGGIAPKQRNSAFLRARLLALFEAEVDGLIAGYDCKESYDAAVATVWWSAPFVASLRAVHKFYFVQDIEALFNPMGDTRLVAEATYDLGLAPIVIGRFLRHYLANAHGTRGRHAEFGADETVYRPSGNARELAVCFLYQPEKPRRCPEIGMKALVRLKQRLPDVKVYTYGSPQRPDLPFEFEHLGLISRQDCNALYNKCRAGLCLSSTNPSRIPFEMMASGLPVVELYGENTIFDLPDEAVILAKPEPNALADALYEILTDPAKAAVMSRAGVEFMAGRSEQRESAECVAALESVMDGEPAPDIELRPVYNKPVFLSNDGMDLMLDWFVHDSAAPKSKETKSLPRAIAGGAARTVGSLIGGRGHSTKGNKP